MGALNAKDIDNIDIRCQDVSFLFTLDSNCSIQYFYMVIMITIDYFGKFKQFLTLTANLNWRKIM